MKKRLFLSLLSVCVLILGSLVFCRLGYADQVVDPVTKPTLYTAPSKSPDVIRAFTQINNQMHQDMAIPLTGDADQDFARSMIPHHQAAIDMANVLLKNGNDPELRSMAQEIIAAQEREIAVLKAWLAHNSQP